MTALRLSIFGLTLLFCLPLCLRLRRFDLVVSRGTTGGVCDVALVLEHTFRVLVASPDAEVFATGENECISVLLSAVRTSCFLFLCL